MVTHNIKCINPYFNHINFGAKQFEVRLNDRNYQNRDIVVLEEYLPETSKYTGRYVMVKISYVLKEFDGLKKGYCVFGFYVLDRGCH
jgi:hypothetical protein